MYARLVSSLGGVCFLRFGGGSIASAAAALCAAAASCFDRAVNLASAVVVVARRLSLVGRLS